jgi:CheY-like chemotaxis protein
VDPEIALRAAVDVLRAAALQAGVRLVVRSSATHAVWADDGKLRQILLNLASNAIKHSPPDAEVELGSADSGDRVELWVRDRGPGVPMELRPRLFQPFAQGEDPLVKRHPGTGLGLAISKRLAEAHGGEIALDDPEDGGARFRVVLPAAGPTTATGTHSIPPVRGRVLVVDDHAANRRLARAVLERVGYRVVEAADGTSALAAATGSPPDLVLLDIAMPGLDGLAVIRSLRADPRTRGVRVVALTALASAEDRERIMAAGFDGFVAKPIEAASLEAAVERASHGRS